MEAWPWVDWWWWMKEGKLEWIGGDGSSVDVCSVPRICGLSSHHGRSVQDSRPKALHLTAHQSPGDSLQEDPGALLETHKGVCIFLKLPRRFR